MHCKECDVLLTDAEAVYKNKATDQYLTLCEACIPIYININYGKRSARAIRQIRQDKAKSICEMSKDNPKDNDPNL